MRGFAPTSRAVKALAEAGINAGTVANLLENPLASEVKRGRLRAAHLGRRVVLLDAEVRRYLAGATTTALLKFACVRTAD